MLYAPKDRVILYVALKGGGYVSSPMTREHAAAIQRSWWFNSQVIMKEGWVDPELDKDYKLEDAKHWLENEVMVLNANYGDPEDHSVKSAETFVTASWAWREVAGMYVREMTVEGDEWKS